MNEHRRTMADYQTESLRMIQRMLSDANFGESFPHVFGHPSEDDAELSVRNQCGLLLQRAQNSHCLSQPIIDEIDYVLAEHYGFTDEELDFIINYDIKYRMGLGSGGRT